MSNYPNLSKADRLIMEVLWKNGEVSNATILKELDGVRDWSRHTVKTYLRRLSEKGLVGIRQINARMNMYYPLIDKKDFIADETTAYLNNHFDSLSHMVAGLIEKEKVSGDEIAKLEQLIIDYKAKDK